MKYKIFYLIVAFSLIHLNIVSAFYQVNKHADEIWIDHTTTQRPTQGNNVFQLHDNFSSNNTDSFFIKSSDDFISADKIEIKIPLKILARDSIYPENSIDRMLLANLSKERTAKPEIETSLDENTLLLPPDNNNLDQDYITPQWKQ